MSTTDFQKYASDCRFMQEDIDNSLDHIKSLDGSGKIWYAVDFSEIYAYLHSNYDEDHTDSTSFFVFEDGQINIAHLREQLILYHLFDNFGEKLALLRPYARELFHYIHSQAETSVMRLVRNVPNLIIEQHRIIQRIDHTINGDVKEITELVENLDPDNPNRNTLNRLMDFLSDQKLQTLIAYYILPERTVVQKINHLFETKVFQDIEDITNLDVYDDPEIRSRWEGKLYRIRSHQRKKTQTKPLTENDLFKLRQSCAIDAQAVAIVANANRRLPDEERLYLLTRSGFMLLNMSSEANDAELEWKKEGFDKIVRHPRMFNILIPLLERDVLNEDRRSELEDLQLLTNTLNKTLMIEPDDPVFSSKSQSNLIKDTIVKLKKYWLNEASLLNFASLQGKSHLIDMDKSELSEVAYKIISIFNQNTDVIRPMLLQRIADIRKSVRSSQEVLGMIARLNPAHSRIVTSVTVEMQKSYDGAITKCVLGTDLHSVQHTIQLFSSAAIELLDEYQESGKLSIGSIVEICEEVFKHFDYERLLIISFILATMREWPAAESYASLALENLDTQIVKYPHEGEFFCGLCVRMNTFLAKPWEKIQRHLRAIELVMQANELKEKSVNELTEIPFKPDPRYLKEIGTNIVQPYVYYYPERVLKDFPYQSDEGISYLKQANEGAQLDKQLKLDILNNLLIFWVTRPETEFKKYDLNEIIQTYEDLYKLSSELEEQQNPTMWRDVSIMKTYYWAKWVLADESSRLNHKDECLWAMKTINSDGLPTPLDQVQIKAITSGFRFLNYDLFD